MNHLCIECGFELNAKDYSALAGDDLLCTVCGSFDSYRPVDVDSDGFATFVDDSGNVWVSFAAFASLRSQAAA